MDTTIAAPETNGAHTTIITENVTAASDLADAALEIEHLIDRSFQGLRALRTLEKIRVCEPAEDYALALASASEFVTNSLEDILVKMHAAVVKIGSSDKTEGNDDEC